MKPVTQKQIDAVLPFLECFEAEGITPGNWVFEPNQIPWFDFNETVYEFCHALYDHGWVTSEFDWTKWTNSAKRYLESPEMIDSADGTTIQKLLTTHVRQDRFCEGHLAVMFKNGHIVALLRRLREIRKEMSDK